MGNINVLNLYKGGKKLLEYCKNNEIDLGVFTCEDELTGYYIEDGAVKFCCSLSDDSNDKVLFENGLVKLISIPRPRANEGEAYYFIDHFIGVSSTIDCRYNKDNSLYEKGNYFLTISEAEEYASRIRQMLLE